MKDLLYLTAGDDLASIKGKLEHSHADELILLASRGVKPLESPLGLKFLRRQASQLGKGILLVSPEKTIRDLARAERIPAFPSLRGTGLNKEEAKALLGATRAQSLGGRLPWGSNPLNLVLWGVTLALLALPLLGGYLLLPSATITLVPAAQEVSDTLKVVATLRAPSVDHASGEIPAHLLETRLEVSAQGETTGRKAAPGERASGQATFLNKLGGKVVVPKGTRVMAANGAKFFTLEEVTLPQTAWGAARVGIIAEEPGSAGNVDRLSLNQVDGPLSFQVAVLNENPTTGGSDKETRFVTSEDQGRLRTRLLQRISEEGLDRLMRRKDATESIYAETLRVSLVEERFDPPLGEEGQQLSLKINATVGALAFDGRQLNTLVRESLEKQLEGGLRLLPESLELQPLGAYAWDEASVSFHVSARAKMAHPIDQGQLKSALKGMSTAEAESYLRRTLSLAEPPQVRIWPDWANTIPAFEGRIQIQVLPRG